MKILWKSKKYHIHNFSSALCSRFFLMCWEAWYCGRKRVSFKPFDLGWVLAMHPDWFGWKTLFYPFKGGLIWHCSTKTKTVDNKCHYSILQQGHRGWEVKPQSQASDSKHGSSWKMKNMFKSHYMPPGIARYNNHPMQMQSLALISLGNPPPTCNRTEEYRILPTTQLVTRDVIWLYSARSKASRRLQEDLGLQDTHIM